MKRGFTLIELLLVIAILAILAGILLPVISRTKEAARSAACLSNLHQIGIALQIYVSDDQNRLPVAFDRSTNSAAPTNGPAINQVLAVQTANVSNVFLCPSDRKQLFELTGSSYSWNSLLNGQDADRSPEFLAWPLIRTRFRLCMTRRNFILSMVTPAPSIISTPTSTSKTFSKCRAPSNDPARTRPKNLWRSARGRGP